MFALYGGEDDYINIEGLGLVKLNLTFDVVLHWFAMKHENEPDDGLIEWAYENWLINPPELTLEDKLDIVEAIVREYIEPTANEDEDDDDGTNTQDIEPPKYYCLTEDARLIYASFLQDYRIDLKNEIGRLSWERFSALLDSLRDDTIFKRAIAIRQMPMPDGKDPDELQRVMNLKDVYALKCAEEIERKRAESQLSDAFASFE